MKLHSPKPTDDLLPESSSRDDKARGFALVLALSLLSFLFLLVLALISYIGVESRLSESRKAYSMARVHARLGLMVAIGELQEHAGPDQRVTATASILDEDPYTQEIDGVYQPYWTGVWKRDPAAPLNAEGQDSAEPWEALPDYEWDPHPEMELTWLVSGNEGKKSSEADYLHPTSSDLPDPDYSGDAVWLVNHSVSQPEERVKALRSPVQAAFYDDTSSSSDEVTGSYAYWVGDEGVKTKVNVPGAIEDIDPQGDFLVNQARFQASPGPKVNLAERPNGSLDLASLDASKLGQIMSVPELLYASSASDEDSTKDYFHYLTTDGYGVLADVLKGGLKRDLTAGLGDEGQFDNYLSGYPIFKDWIRFVKDYDPLDWSREPQSIGGNLSWAHGITDEHRPLTGPLWDLVKDYYMLFDEINFNPSDPLEASLPPRPIGPENYPNRNGEFWTKNEDERTDPRTHPITPLLLEAKIGHTLEMVPFRGADANGKTLYRPTIAIYPSLALWNPYNVELEAAVYEFSWRPDPKFWVYPTRDRTKWARKLISYEVANKIPARQRYWDENGDGILTGRQYNVPHPNPPWWNPNATIAKTEYNTMHSTFLGTSTKARQIPYGQKPGQGGGGTGNVSIGTGLRSMPRAMHRKGFFLYRYAPRNVVDAFGKPLAEHERNTGWRRGAEKLWHTMPGSEQYKKSILLRTNSIRMAPGEKLYFTLAESRKFNPAESQVFNLRNHLSFNNYLSYDVPLKLCPPMPEDQPVTFVYTGGYISAYAVRSFQQEEELDAANKNPRIKGFSLYMIKGGQRHPLKKINYGLSSIGLNRSGSYQDYGRADIVSADPSRVIGPRIEYLLATAARHDNSLVFAERNPRSLVDPWHLGRGVQWGGGQETALEGGIGDTVKDDVGVVFSQNPNPDESLSGSWYDGGGRIYYGYQGHSFDINGFHRVSRSAANNREAQFLPGASRVALFDVPRQPLLSLGALQHVNLCYFGNSPSYAIGNSYATMHVSRNRKWTRFNQLSVVPLDYGHSKRRGGNEHQNTLIDYSYYANETLWDGFFFSGVPTRYLNTSKYPPFENFDQDYVDAGKPLPNPRMVYYSGPNGKNPDTEEEGGLRDFQQAAGNLLVDGAFNVNSTSVEAWKAQLGSLSQNQLLIRDMQDNYDLASNGHKESTLDFASDQFPFPRLSVSTGEPVNPESGDIDQDFWTGFASLDEDQLERLAEEIVQEVKFRGPFLSMGDFVNRRLANPPDNQILRKLYKTDWPNETEDSRQGLRGALQAAIHDAGINDGGFRERYGYQDARDSNDLSRRSGLDLIPHNVGQITPFGFAAVGYRHDYTDRTQSQVPNNRYTNWARGYDRSIPNPRPVPNEPGVWRTSYYPQREFLHGEAPDNILAATNAVTGAMMPGWLNQADILTPLGPVINARSDTFRVRAYGDAGPNYPDVKVWCEAIIQRVPEYVVDDVRYPDYGDPPHARPMEPYEDLNGNGVHDSGEPFIDYDFDESRSFNEDYGDQELQNPDNERFGRRFRIVKFRWLSAEEA